MTQNDEKDVEKPLFEEYIQRPPSPKFYQKTARKKEMFRNGKNTGKIHHIPLAGSAIVEVVHIESPSAFWVRPYNHITSNLILVEPTGEPLYQKRYGVIEELVNKYCMAPLEETSDDNDGSENVRRRYGRVRVLEVSTENKLARVIFIDEGRLLWVHVHCLAEMPDIFYYHPWQAMFVCLGGVVPVDPCMDDKAPRWTEDQVNIFRETIQSFELFQIRGINTTTIYDDYARAHLVQLFGLTAKLLDRVSQINVDIGGLFTSKAVNTVINSPTFNAATFIPARTVLISRIYDMQDIEPRYKNFPHDWHVEESDERIEKRNIIAGENLRSWPFDANTKEFQIPHMDVEYLKNNGFINNDGTVAFHIFGYYLQSPYEFYGSPYKRTMHVVAPEDDENGAHVIEHTFSLREASYALIEARKELANSLDIFYRKKFHRIQLDRRRVELWLKEGVRVYAICNCSGMERRKRFGVYQRVEIISPLERGDNYRVRFIDSGGIFPQVHCSEIYQIHATHCQQMAMSMQLCWHGVKDSNPELASRKMFQPSTLNAFRENFYCDGPIRLTLLGSHAPNNKIKYNAVPALPCHMWNVTCVSLIELDPSITEEVNLLQVMQFEGTCDPSRLIIDPRYPFDFIPS